MTLTSTTRRSGADAASSAWAYTLQVPHDPLTPGVARTLVRTVLGRHGLPGLVETAELLTSELVTNAFRYACGPASVRLNWDGRRLRVGVWDTNARLPEAAGLCGEHDGGRGLQLMDLCADNWGSFLVGKEPPGTSLGKVVWFECSDPTLYGAP